MQRAWWKTWQQRLPTILWYRQRSICLCRDLFIDLFILWLQYKYSIYNIYIFVYTYIYVHVYIYICTCVYIYITACIYIYVLYIRLCFEIMVSSLYTLPRICSFPSSLHPHFRRPRSWRPWWTFENCSMCRCPLIWWSMTPWASQSSTPWTDGLPGWSGDAKWIKMASCYVIS